MTAYNQNGGQRRTVYKKDVHCFILQNINLIMIYEFQIILEE